MTTSYNKTATSFKELETKLKAEFARRNQNGSLADISVQLNDVGGVSS